MPDWIEPVHWDDGLGMPPGASAPEYEAKVFAAGADGWDYVLREAEGFATARALTADEAHRLSLCLRCASYFYWPYLCNGNGTEEALAYFPRAARLHELLECLLSASNGAQATALTFMYRNPSVCTVGLARKALDLCDDEDTATRRFAVAWCSQFFLMGEFSFRELGEGGREFPHVRLKALVGSAMLDFVRCHRECGPIRTWDRRARERIAKIGLKAEDFPAYPVALPTPRRVQGQ